MTFAGAYIQAETVSVFKSEHLKCRWVKKFYAEELASINVNFASDEELMEFLKYCNDFEKESIRAEEQHIKDVLSVFADDVKAAFDHMFKLFYCEYIEFCEDKVVILLDISSAYTRKLILHTTQTYSPEKLYCIETDTMELKKTDGGYSLTFTYSAEVEPVSIAFDDAYTKVDVYRANSAFLWSSPWDMLSNIAFDIVCKGDLEGDFFNQKERELLPLIRDVACLSASGYRSLSLMDEKPDFTTFKQYLAEYNLTDIIPLVDKLVNRNPAKYNNFVVLDRIQKKLSKTSGEALWRKIYGLFTDSQAEYPEEVAMYEPKRLEKIRQKTERCLHKLGYEGKYPDFVKKGRIKGIKLESNYNMTYFVGGEKNTEFVIHCKENVTDGKMQIQFLCGTAFLRKNECLTDIYSCCFNAKGKRLFKSALWSEEEDSSLCALERHVQIAAKKAECAKLNKDEHSLLGDERYGFKTFLSFLIGFGGFFAVFMTAAMCLFACVMVAISDGIIAVPEAVSKVPWWLMFLFCFFGFGIPMAIIETKSMNK